MVHLLRFLAFLICSSVTFADDSKYVKFPSKDEVKQKMKEHGMQHVIERTKILDIVEKSLTVVEVDEEVNRELVDYIKNTTKGMPESLVRVGFIVLMDQKISILHILLSADSQALQEYQSSGIGSSK